MRTQRTLFIGAWLGLALCASYAGGGHLRRITEPQVTRSQVASLAETGTFALQPQQDNGGTSPEDLFRDIVRYVRSDYVDTVKDESKLNESALRTMIMSLDDPKTRYYTSEQMKQLEAQLDGKFTGAGCTLTVTKQKQKGVESRRLTVVSAAPGSAAEKAGVQPGDFITEVNGKWIIAYDPRVQVVEEGKELDRNQLRDALKDAVKQLQDGLSLPKALETLMSDKTQNLTLTLERTGSSAPVKLTFDTSNIAIPSAEWRAINDKVGYLKISALNGSASEIALKSLSAQKQPLLILDLRNNPGGVVAEGRYNALSSALGLVSKLTKGGPVASITRRNKKVDPITVPVGQGSTIRKIAVLVNRGTANVAELLAAALKEKASAVLVGQPTFGDGVYQKLVRLSNGGGIIVNGGTLKTVGGIEFAGKGLQPDRVVTEPGDAAVQRAAAILQGGA